jgi:hypothetical protein
MAVMAPLCVIGDDDESAPGAGDGDIEQVRSGSRPFAGAVLVGRGTQDQDDDVGLLALCRVDGADTAIGNNVLEQALQRVDDIAEGADDEQGVGYPPLDLPFDALLAALPVSRLASGVRGLGADPSAMRWRIRLIV